MSFFCISNPTWEGLQRTGYPHLGEDEGLTLEVGLPTPHSQGQQKGAPAQVCWPPRQGGSEILPPAPGGVLQPPRGNPCCTPELSVSVPLLPFCSVCRRPPWLFLTGAVREPQAKSRPLTALGKQAWTGSRGQLRTSPLSSRGWLDRSPGRAEAEAEKCAPLSPSAPHSTSAHSAHPGVSRLGSQLRGVDLESQPHLRAPGLAHNMPREQAVMSDPDTLSH